MKAAAFASWKGNEKLVHLPQARKQGRGGVSPHAMEKVGFPAISPGRKGRRGTRFLNPRSGDERGNCRKGKRAKNRSNGAPRDRPLSLEKERRGAASPFGEATLFGHSSGWLEKGGRASCTRKGRENERKPEPLSTLVRNGGGREVLSPDGRKKRRNFFRGRINSMPSGEEGRRRTGRVSP